MNIDDMVIRQLMEREEPPVQLLLLADPSIEMINDYIKRGICFIAESGNKILGTYILLKTKPMTFEIVNVAVIEEMQGKGIGKKLLYHAIDEAKKRGAKVIEIGTGNSSMSQLALYQRYGFRITGVIKDFFIKYYDNKIYENGIQCIDMIRLSKDL